jgi:formate-dependent nitrite reductase membrane component NrfD
MIVRQPFWSNFIKVMLIAGILAATDASIIVIADATHPNTMWQNDVSYLANMFFFCVVFFLIFISIWMLVVILPLTLVGLERGWFQTLRSSLTISVPLGLVAFSASTFWLFRDGEWLIMTVVGMLHGLVAGFLWWYIIGKNHLKSLV